MSTKRDRRTKSEQIAMLPINGVENIDPDVAYAYLMELLSAKNKKTHIQCTAVPEDDTTQPKVT